MTGFIVAALRWAVIILCIGYVAVLLLPYLHWFVVLFFGACLVIGVGLGVNDILRAKREEAAAPPSQEP